MEQNSKILK